VDIKIQNKITRMFASTTIGGYTFQIPSVSRDLTTQEGVFEFIVYLLNYAIGFSVFVAIAMIVFSGYLFITAAGDPDKIQKGSSSLTAAVVGLIVVFLARTIILFILEKFLGAV
jgi:hypothetical protein